MAKNKHNTQAENENLASLLAGILLGSLAGLLTGALAMLLLAPQSGRKTRTKIQKKGREMRDHTAVSIDEGIAQVRGKAHEVSAGFQKQIDDLQHRGQDAVDGQKERWTPVLEASKTAVNGA